MEGGCHDTYAPTCKINYVNMQHNYVCPTQMQYLQFGDETLENILIIKKRTTYNDKSRVGDAGG